MNKYRWILLAVACLVITGCVEEKSEITLNPDGSGKVVYETTIQPVGYQGALDLRTNSQVELYRTIGGLLTCSAGVDAWKDVSYKFVAEGEIYFKGTAYFSDISKLNIPSRYSGSHMIRHTEKNEKGEIVINVESRNLDSSGEQEAEDTTAELTEAELNKQVQDTKLEYNQAKGIMSDMISHLSKINI